MSVSKPLISLIIAAGMLLNGCASGGDPGVVIPPDPDGGYSDTAEGAAPGGGTTGTATGGTEGTTTSGTTGATEGTTGATEGTTGTTGGTSGTTGETSGTTGGTTGSTGGTSGTTGGTTGTTGGTTGTTGGTSGTTGGTSKPTGSGLSEKGSGYEGTKSTGDFNYGEALQKAILFYELQRSGDINEKTARTNWRGDSGMNDGADVGLDLTGGLYDAGDNVKFNLPMAYTSAMLAWSVYEDRDAYEKSGQLTYILDNIRWINDYLIKCHPEDDVYYYQVGDGNADHSWWGPAEVMQMNRPSYKVTVSSPGSTVVAEAAASLAACAAVFAKEDPTYAATCLKHSKQLYDFAERTKSDSGYTAANGFYNSWSGFYDELSWAGAWLYIATNDKSYLDKAKQYAGQAGGNYKWTQCWDDVFTGAVTLLAKITGEQQYKDKVEKNLDWWTTGTGGERITYSPKGLAWLDTWGSLRYATTAAFIAAVYADWDGCPSSKKTAYMNFCESQVNYALGSTGRSFVVGYGVNPPEHPHHRTAQASWADNMNEPNYHRHTLYGALVGGPGSGDNYTDTVSDYTANEVACDYNAGFVGALAKMYGKYGGQTLKNFGAVEPVGEELYVEQRVNAQGNGFTEIKAMVYNKTAWPARVTDNLELRYFIDLTELYESGGSASDITISTNYSDGAKSNGLYIWNEAKHIYYVSIDFSGVKIYPGGQSAYKKEVQFRMTSSNGVWNPDNDPSYKELVGTNGSELLLASHVGLYEGGVLVFGTQPDGKSAGAVKPSSGSGASGSGSGNSGSQTTVTPPGNTTSTPQKPTAEDNGLSVSLNQQSVSGSGNTIQFTLDVINNTGAAINLKDLEIDYFFTADGYSDLNFWCDHSATSGENYTALTSDVSGSFSKASGTNADTKCAIKFSSGTLAAGASLTVQVRITRADWSDFVLGNDWSAGNAEHIQILKNGSPIFGEKP